MGFFKNAGKVIGNIGRTALKVGGSFFGVDTSALTNPGGILAPRGTNIVNQGSPFPSNERYTYIVPQKSNDILTNANNFLRNGLQTTNSISPQTILLLGGVGILLIYLFKKK